MYKSMCVVVWCFFIYICLVTSELLTYRLSSTEAIPSTYSLTIRPDFENEIFHGEVSIYVLTKNNLEGITLHSHKLNISEVYINHIKGCYEHRNDEKITVKYDNEFIQPGEHFIQIKYTGKICKNGGFIKAIYEDKETLGYVFVTDLQPHKARTVFPCFDEPSFKAHFNLRLISPNESFVAISNMPEIKKYSSAGDVVYDFETSVKMSTYLVSFAFTNYPYYEEHFEYNGKNIPIRIYTLNASKTNNIFAINCTKKALKFYSDYTNISYPLPKLDMIEYKRNESAATENWGLITFREGLLTTSLKFYDKYQIKLVMFHELSHFWFGNLVTNAWWNDIWLQEGFATYMSYKLLAEDGNNTDQLSEMKAFNFDEFLETEIYENSRPIISYLSNVNNIKDIFNGMVYDKASSLLLMLENVIGQEKFKEVIRRYLSRHAYSIVTTNDFISIVEEVVPKMSLRTFLESYLYQSKFPVIDVEIENNNTYVLKQHIAETVRNGSNRPSRWSIPITYRTDSKNITGPIWFNRDMEELRIVEPDAKWLVFNPKGDGMYKTMWSRKLWSRFIDSFEMMDDSSRETVISDAYYSFRFNKICCDILLLMNELVTKERRKSLIMFVSFYDHLVENLSCNEYKYETTFFVDYLKKKFMNAGFLKFPEFKKPNSCKTKYILTNKDYLTNLNKCGTWIVEHLPKEDSNVIKRNS